MMIDVENFYLDSRASAKNKQAAINASQNRFLFYARERFQQFQCDYRIQQLS